MAYTLTLTAVGGATVSGTLDIYFSGEDKLSGDQGETALASTGETKVFVTPITGKLSIDGIGSCDLSGVNYASVMGPPLTNILIGTVNGDSVGVQFNVIDSPGVYIGGSVLIGKTPYSLLGQR